MDEKEDFRNQLREALPDVDKPKRTICEVHREIYDRLDELGLAEDPQLSKFLEDAYALGKKMDAKLRQHHLRKGDDWYANERARVLDETLLKRRSARIARRIERQAERKADERKE